MDAAAACSLTLAPAPLLIRVLGRPREDDPRWRNRFRDSFGGSFA